MTVSLSFGPPAPGGRDSFLGGQDRPGGQFLQGSLAQGQDTEVPGHLRGYGPDSAGGLPERRSAAHAHRAAEQAPGGGDAQQRGAGTAARRLARDRHPARVSAEGRDVFLHPFQGAHPVTHGPVGRRAGHLEEALGTEPVIDADQDHAVPRERAAAIPGRGVAPAEKSAAVDPDQDRQPGRAQVGREDVQVELVVSGDDRLRDHRDPAVWLRRCRPVGERVPDPVPAAGRHRGGEAPRRDRRLSVRDTEEPQRLAVPRAAQAALRRLCDDIVGHVVPPQARARTMACRASPTPAPTTVPLMRMYCRSRPRSSSSWLDVSAASHRSMVPVTRPARSS